MKPRRPERDLAGTKAGRAPSGRGLQTEGARRGLNDKGPVKLPQPPFRGTELGRSVPRFNPRRGSRAQVEHYQRRLDHAHRRYLSALKALALVRKLALPVLQVNIAKKQVNVAGVVPEVLDGSKRCSGE
jgi:hypothetical protein